MGEQVAGKAGYGWFDGVRADLEATGYSSRAVDIPALAVNAPHIRQRLYWVALDVANAQQHSHGCEASPSHHDRQEGDRSTDQHGGRGSSSIRDMADPYEGGRGRRPRDGNGERDGQAGERHEDHGVAAGGGEDRLDVADASIIGREERERQDGQQDVGGGSQSGVDPAGAGSFWSDAVWLNGSDAKARRAKPGLPLLAYGVSNRVGRLRAYGNAIVAPLAAEVVKALMETLDV